MKLISIIGARPQFIKASSLTRAIKRFNNKKNTNFINEIIIHTGQHFDNDMSKIFFDELNIPIPQYNLGISSLTHGAMTGRMIEKIEEILLIEKPNAVIVYGDTNSTLAGSIAASKIGFPIVHIEAGIRSHNFSMPEEINRVLSDRVSNFLMCPTKNAVKNLKKESYPFLMPNNDFQKIIWSGDVMFDSVLYYKNIAKNSYKYENIGVSYKKYIFCTIHREENTNDSKKLKDIWLSLNNIVDYLDVVLPIHPRTKKALTDINIDVKKTKIKLINPISYLETQFLLMGAKQVMTDSGGLQKEAYFHKVPCITLRNETEWIETVEDGWNILSGSNEKKILNAFDNNNTLKKTDNTQFGNGKSAEIIIREIMDNL